MWVGRSFLRHRSSRGMGEVEVQEAAPRSHRAGDQHRPEEGSGGVRAARLLLRAMGEEQLEMCCGRFLFKVVGRAVVSPSPELCHHGIPPSLEQSIPWEFCIISLPDGR